MIRGIDVSGWQPKVDWAKVRDAGADFCIVKITEGNGHQNIHAKAQIDGAEAAGLFVMVYHFARPNGPDWEEDAYAEMELARALAGDRFLFLDVERNDPLTLHERPLWRHWCSTFRKAYGKPIGWYSYKPFTEQLALEQDWEDTVLWLARYLLPWRKDGDYAKWPDAPLPWARTDVWQDGGDANEATWPGVTGYCDTNLFAGTLDEMKALLASAK